MDIDVSTIPNHSLINDIRTSAKFKGVTFSKYKKADVRKQLIENMKNGKLEPASYWCAELVCAGHFMEAWESIITLCRETYSFRKSKINHLFRNAI